jgi:hypothetical protein
MTIHHKVTKSTKSTKKNDGRFAQDERTFVFLRVLYGFVVNLVCVHSSVLQGSGLGLPVAAGALSER